MNEEMFKEIGLSVSQIGYYLTTIDKSIFKKNEINENIVKFLFQIAICLKGCIESNENIKFEKEKVFLSKNEVIKEYSPLITNYALSQAINKNTIEYIKRGSKYFFEVEEINKWLQTNKKKIVQKKVCKKYV